MTVAAGARYRPQTAGAREFTMYFNLDDDEREPFADFGEPEAVNDDVAASEDVALDTFRPSVDETQVIEPRHEPKVKTGFSWAGFTGGLAALIWIAGAIGGPLSYFGVDAVMTMDPAMQAGLIALAFGPALLFWVSASAAGEALKARRVAVELARGAYQPTPSFPTEAAASDAQRLTNTVKHEIENLNDAVATALNRLAELERSAARNAALFNEAVIASRENTEAMAQALKTERDAALELNADLKGQTDTIANSIGRQIRLMREASKLVKTEVVAAEDALESHLAAFTASATVMGERTAAFHTVADKAAAATSQLNGTMHTMLEGLSEATRLTETARKSTEQAVLAANETAGAVRETTRAAVYEAKRAAQLIRAETVAMQEAANDTLAKLQDAANAARRASEESEAAADRYTARIEQRLGALATAAGGKKVAVAQRPVERVVERKPEPVVVHEELNTLHAAANAAVARGGSRPRVERHVETRVDVAETQPKRVFKGFGSWGNFMPQREEAPPVAANEDAFELADFGSEPANPDAELKSRAIDLVTNAGVDLEDVLLPSDLERIARSSREGASARRRAVVDAAPGAVGRLTRHMKRNANAAELAVQFRSRPDLAKSDNKGEGSDLVRAYLLIDAALA